MVQQVDFGAWNVDGFLDRLRLGQDRAIVAAASLETVFPCCHNHRFHQVEVVIGTDGEFCDIRNFYFGQTHDHLTQYHDIVHRDCKRPLMHLKMYATMSLIDH